MRLICFRIIFWGATFHARIECTIISSRYSYTWLPARVLVCFRLCCGGDHTCGTCPRSRVRYVRHKKYVIPPAYNNNTTAFLLDVHESTFDCTHGGSGGVGGDGSAKYMTCKVNVVVRIGARECTVVFVCLCVCYALACGRVAAKIGLTLKSKSCMRPCGLAHGAWFGGRFTGMWVMYRLLCARPVVPAPSCNNCV